MHDDIAHSTQHCIDESLRCYRVCFGFATNHCLIEGGAHVEPQHFRIMLACAEICRSFAHVLLLSAPLNRALCHACAEICEQCAHSCDRIGDMKECAEICRRCAECCQRLAEH